MSSAWPRATRALWCALSLAIAVTADAAPLGDADRASVDALLAALESDPMADAPLTELQSIYRRGPGLQTLHADFAARAQRKTPSAADLVVLGRLELARGRRADGLRTLGRAVTVATEPALLRSLARLLDENGARADAIRAYRAGRTGASAAELRQLNVRLGVLLLAEGKVPEARAVWAEATSAAPADAALRRQVAESLASRGALREAIAELQVLEGLVAKEPVVLVAALRREAEFLSRLGDRTGVSDTLLRAYVAAAELRQGAARAELTADLLRAYKGKRGLAELLQVVKRHESKSPALAALEGDVLAASDDVAGARAAFRRALAARGDDIYALRRLCSLSTGDERLDGLTRLFDLDRGDATVGLELIAALFQAKLDAHAVNRGRVLKERFGTNALVLSALTRTLSTHGQHAEALAVAAQVLKLDPDNPDSLIVYGDELLAMKRPAEAAKAYFQLVEKDPSINGYRNLIDVLARRRLNDELKRAYEQAIARAPEAHSVRRDYARLLSSLGEADQAMAQWKAIEAGSKDAFLREFAARELKRLSTEKLLHR